jgi:hypothetical protein
LHTKLRELLYGGSQKVAYSHCISQGYSTVVMLHGDAQYAPELVDPTESLTLPNA